MTPPPPARSRRRRSALLVAIAAVVVAVDQVTKSLAVAGLSHHGVTLVGPVGFRLAYNSGIAFSLGTSLTGPIIIVVVVAVLLLAFLARRVPTTLASVGAGLVLGGAVGNLCDRLFRGHHGAVVDFIYTRYWPTFNVADACIVCGCVILGWSFLRPRREREESAPA